MVHFFCFMDRSLQKAFDLIGPILLPLGFELVDLQLATEPGRRILRVLIDKEGGISVGDCEKASREIETAIEVEEVIRERYSLEVSSPGLDRPLVKEADFVRFAGQTASIKTREPIEGRRNYKGTLKGVEAGEIVIEVDHQDYRIPWKLIEKANLVF